MKVLNLDALPAGGTVVVPVDESEMFDECPRCDPGQVNPECGACGGGGFAPHRGEVQLAVAGRVVGTATARIDWVRYESHDIFTGCFVWVDGRRWVVADEWRDRSVVVLTGVERVAERQP